MKDRADDAMGRAVGAALEAVERKPVLVQLDDHPEGQGRRPGLQDAQMLDAAALQGLVELTGPPESSAPPNSGPRPRPACAAGSPARAGRTRRAGFAARRRTAGSPACRPGRSGPGYPGRSSSGRSRNFPVARSRRMRRCCQASETISVSRFATMPAGKARRSTSRWRLPEAGSSSQTDPEALRSMRSRCQSDGLFDAEPWQT